MSEQTDGGLPENYAAGWYDNPKAPGRRYYDGEQWTDSYAPPVDETGVTSKDLLWALALGFGGVGAAGAIAIPIMAFYIPLGFGVASAALIIAALTSPGRTQWWAALAVIGCLAGLGTGFSAYDDFESASSAADRAIDSFSP